MDSINRLTGYPNISVPRSPDTGSVNQKGRDCLHPTSDTYISDRIQVPAPKSKTVPFTEDLAADFAKKYDIKNMDRNQYTRLLAGLRDAGVLTSQEFSAAYGGSMPSAASGLSWPQGHQTADFSKLIQDCAQWCSEAIPGNAGETGEEANDLALSSTYAHLKEIFSAIEGASASQQEIYLTREQQEWQEIEQLIAVLKEDKAFCESTNRSLLDHPIAQKLAFAMIRADEHMQALTAEKLDVSIPQMMNMMNSSDGLTSAQVLFQFKSVLLDKAKDEGLSDTEQLLDSGLEQANFIAQSTFGERMENVKEQIDQALQEKGMCLDPSKSYSFSLDTSNFTFSVSGGADAENSIIADVLNNSQNRLTVLSALYGHKKEDGQTVSEEYTDKMERLFPAYNQWTQEVYMQERYGFGMDDIEYVGGYNIIGKTDDKITEQIKSLGMEFITFGGGVLLSNIDHMLNTRYGFGLHEVDFTENGRLVGKTKEVNALIAQAGDRLYDDIKQPPKIDVPVFDKPVFTMQSGQFSVLYD